MNSSDRATKINDRLASLLQEEKKMAEKTSSGKELARSGLADSSSSTAAFGAGLMSSSRSSNMGMAGIMSSNLMSSSSVSSSSKASMLNAPVSSSAGGLMSNNSSAGVAGSFMSSSSSGTAFGAGLMSSSRSSNTGVSGNNNSFTPSMGMMSSNSSFTSAADGAGGLMMPNNSSAGLAMSGPDSLSSFSSSTMPSFSTSMGMMSNHSSAALAGSSSAAMGAGLMSSNFASGSSNTMPPMPATAPSFVPPSSTATSLTNATSRSFDMNDVLNLDKERTNATIPVKKRPKTKVQEGKPHSEDAKVVMREVASQMVNNGSHHALAENSGRRNPMQDAQTLMNDTSVTDVERSTYMSPGGTNHLAVLLMCSDKALGKLRGKLADKDKLSLQERDFIAHGMKRCDEDKDVLIPNEHANRSVWTRKFYDPSGRFGTARVSKMTRTETAKKGQRTQKAILRKKNSKTKKEKKRKACDSDEESDEEYLG